MLLRNHTISRIVVFSRDEMKQYEMEQSLMPEDRQKVRFFIGDVRDLDRLQMAMRDIDCVVHAAALKHVTAAEYNPFECVKTNIHGAENVVTAAIRTGVASVLALSTDKACNPVNLYGATKLASDKIFVAGNSLSGAGGCRFSVVRYGNVMGSRGSVLPLFQSLIRQGATELPITDPRMTRFWITIDQGVAFVLSSLAQMEGGEIFVPKIPSMRVVDLASALLPDGRQKVIGIRPGEKLHEVMIGKDDSMQTIDRGDRFIIAPSHHPWRSSSYLNEGDKTVEDGFSYESDTNSEWLTQEALRALIGQ